MITVEEFHEKYSRYPTVLDPYWRRELRRDKVLSKMQVVDMPILNPGKCACCGCADNSRKYVDLGVDLDPSEDDRFAFAIYICMHCVRELMLVAFKNGLLPHLHIPELKEVTGEAPVANIAPVADESPMMRLTRVEGKLDAVLDLVSSNLTLTHEQRVSSVDEPKAKLGSSKSLGAEQGSPKSNPGRRSKGVPSLDELIKGTNAT